MTRFIVGTGRSGSTLLSRMLSCNPEVLVISEFFVGLDWSKRFRPEPIGGREFRELIAAPHPFVTMVLERGYLPPEVTYPFGSPKARYAPGEPLPWLLAAALPRLTNDPDDLFDEACTFADAMPERPPPAQSQALFEWLCERTGRKAWIERSGASIAYVGDLSRAFPGGRFLHIHRTGEEAALSAREHPVFRLAVMLTYQIPLGEPGDRDALARLGKDVDHVSKLLASRPPAKYFGLWWTEQLLAGFRALVEVDADQYHELRFESLSASPEAALEQACRFLALPDPTGSWRSEAAKLLVSAEPLVRYDALSPQERDELAHACAPGNRLLGRR